MKILNKIPKLKEVIEKIQDKTLTIQQASIVLNWIKQIIEDKWEIVSEYCHYAGKTPGGTPMFRLNRSILLSLRVKFPPLILKQCARFLLTGFFLGDVSVLRNFIDLSTYEVELLLIFSYILASYVQKNELTLPIYIRQINLTKKGPHAILNLRVPMSLDEYIPRVDPQAVYSAIGNEAVSHGILVKCMKVLHYIENDLISKDTVFTWYVCDGVSPHDNSIDLGISMKLPRKVIELLDKTFSRIFNTNKFFTIGDTSNNIYYITCPAKKYVIEIIRYWSNKIPQYLHTKRIRKLLSTVNYVEPCKGSRKSIEVEVYGTKLLARKRHGGYVLVKSSGDLTELLEVKKKLEKYGITVLIHRFGHGFELYIPKEESMKILRELGVVKQEIRPSTEEIMNVIRKYVSREFRWHIHRKQSRNGRGYMYTEECVYISTGSRDFAMSLASELERLGISVRKAVYGTILVCREVDRELVKKALLHISNK